MTATSTTVQIKKKKFQNNGNNKNTVFLLDTEQLRADSPYYQPSQDKPYNPDFIAKKRPQFGIYDEMRRDDQVKAVLWLKKFMILASGWEIKAEKDEYKTAADEIASDISGIEDPDFGDAICNMLSHLDYGFSISEPVFELKETGRIGIKSLKTRPPHSFEFRTDNYGNIMALVQYVSEGFLSTDMHGLIHMVHQYEFGIPYGTSDLQAAYTAWFSKQRIIKFWNIFLERFGNPHVVITVPGSISETDKAALEDIIRNLQAKSGMQVPAGTEVDIKGSPTGATDFEKAIDKYNGMIARSMLVPDLIGISGPTIAGGSYALGEKHFEIFYMTIEKERTDLERSINKHIVWPMAFYNYGINDHSSLFWQIIRPSTDDKMKLLDLWLRATQAKIWDPNDEEVNHFRKQVRFPTGPVEKAEPLNNPFRPSYSKHAMFIKRDKTQYEKKVDFAKVTDEHDGLEEKAKKSLELVYKKVLEGLRDTIQHENMVQSHNIDAVNQLKLKYLKDMDLTWRGILRESLSSGVKSAKAEVKEARKEVMMQDIDPATLFEEAIDERSFYITGVERDRILRDARQVLLTAIDQGLSNREAIKRLEKVFEDNYALDSQLLETIVRTNVNKAFNYGRRKMFEDSSLEGYVKAYQYSAIIDERTTDVCEALDQKIYKVDNPYLQKITPPLHFNCRSLLVPVTEGEEFTESPEVVKEADLIAFKGIIT